MTDQDANPGNGQDIQRQFALLQEEMKRAMAVPPGSPADSAAIDAVPATDPTAFDESGALRRIELVLEHLRRDADRLRTRMPPATQDPAMVGAIVGLGGRIDAVTAEVAAVGKAIEDTSGWLRRAWQTNLEALDELGLRIEALGRRRKSRWLTPLAILVGASVIAAAVVASVPGRAQKLIDRTQELVFADKPHAQMVPPPLPTTAPLKTAEAPAPQAPTVPPPSAPPPPPAVAAPPIAEGPSPPPPKPVATPTPPPPAVASPALTPLRQPAPSGQIVIRAKADAWVEIRNHQGSALLQRVFHPGETWPVPDGLSLLLSTGNAGGLELLVDGNPAPPLGGMGLIRRDVRLDPELVRAGHYGPDQPGRVKSDTAVSR